MVSTFADRHVYLVYITTYRCPPCLLSCSFSCLLAGLPACNRLCTTRPDLNLLFILALLAFLLTCPLASLLPTSCFPAWFCLIACLLAIEAVHRGRI